MSPEEKDVLIADLRALVKQSGLLSKVLRSGIGEAYGALAKYGYTDDAPDPYHGMVTLFGLIHAMGRDLTELRKAVKDAEHGKDCAFREWECSQLGCGETHSIDCNCWKSRIPAPGNPPVIAIRVPEAAEVTELRDLAKDWQDRYHVLEREIRGHGCMVTYGEDGKPQVSPGPKVAALMEAAAEVVAQYRRWPSNTDERRQRKGLHAALDRLVAAHGERP